MSYKIEITKNEIFCVKPISPQWLGVGISTESSGFTHPGDRRNRVNGTFEMPNGWTILGEHGCDNTGCGFYHVIALHNDPDIAVFSNYETGLYCKNRELLEKFCTDFPPYDVD